MTGDRILPVGAGEYRCMGLIADPFDSTYDAEGSDPIGVRAARHSAMTRVVAAIAESVSSQVAEPVWVDKPSTVSGYYHLSALAQLLNVLFDNDSIGVLPVYAPIELARLGRIRGILSVCAEGVAGPDFDKTLAAYVRDVLETPDATLPELAALSHEELQSAGRLFRDAPLDAAKRYFGECVHERDPGFDPDETARAIVVRQRALEVDPSEADDSAEVDTSPVFEESFLTASDTGTAEQVPEAEDAEPKSSPEDALAEYVVAHTRAHLSPVVARAILAYKNHGTGSAGEELKITKAPKKTLAAIIDFACHRFEKLALILDHFELWGSVPDSIRGMIAGTLAELRMRLGDRLLLVFLAPEGEAPELRSQVPGKRIMWDMPEIVDMEQPEPAYDEAVVRRWTGAARLGSKDFFELNREALSRIAEAAGGSMEAFIRMASSAVRDVATRGGEGLDNESVDKAVSQG